MNIKIMSFWVLIFTCSILFSNPSVSNDWWGFLNKKYHFNIDKNFDIYTDSANGYSIVYIDIKFDNYSMSPKNQISGKNKLNIANDFVIKYEKKEIVDDKIIYTNALLISRGEDGHDACKANHITVNKKTKEIIAKSCSFSRLFDDVSNKFNLSKKEIKYSHLN
jgi:hypothetical protein